MDAHVPLLIASLAANVLMLVSLALSAWDNYRLVKELKQGEARLDAAIQRAEERERTLHRLAADADRWRRIFADSMANRPVVVREREVEG
ncbi:MAG TPA: hypothetical protein VF167_01890 [Longimicrobiaceae bacterium]